MKMLLTHPTRLNPGSWLAGSLLALIAALLSAGQAPAQEPKAQEKEAQERDLRVTAPGRQFTVTARGTTLTRTLIRTATMQWQKALESPVTCLALSPDASLLAAGCREQSLSILHTADGTMVW